MTIQLSDKSRFLGMVDPEKGVVAREIFSDESIYQLELERIFARAWNFMAHDSQIPNPGDFFLTYIGEDRVIVVRDKEMQPQVLINSCRHRGNAVCRAEEGHATSFMCTYHGWTYDLKGALVGVPGFKEVYHEDINREEWGLIRAAQVDSHKGFIFATLDESAPSLQEYLGEVGRMSINQLALKGNIKAVPGIQKYTIGCNWKLSADNVWDFYHPNISHASSNMARWNMGGSNRRAVPEAAPAQPATPPAGLPSDPAALERALGLGAPHIVVLGEYGHAISGPKMTDMMRMALAAQGMVEAWRDKPEVMEELGPVGTKVQFHPHVFPNLWFTGNQVCLRLPKSPTSTEIWWMTFIDQDLDPALQERQISSANHVFGPAGMLEQDDGENWDQSTRGTMGPVIREYPLHYAMNVGRGQVIQDDSGIPYIETHVNEHAQLWLYRAWTEWMASEDWADLKANHSPVPLDKV